MIPIEVENMIKSLVNTELVRLTEKLDEVKAELNDLKVEINILKEGDNI